MMGTDLKYGLTATLVLLFSVCIGWGSCAFYDDEKTLRTSVLSGYEYKIRPNETVTVNVKLSMLNINLLEVQTQRLSISGWLTFTWTDDRLTWDPATNGDIEDIYDLENVFWRPEVIVDNSISNIGVISDDALLIRATSVGEMTWEPPGIYETHCDVDVTYYPFDTQICVVEVTSWGYTLNEVSLQALESTINLDDYQESGEWDILSSWTERHALVDGDDLHSKVFFYLKLQRRPNYYITTILLPVIVTSLLCGWVFILPVESGEKIGYSLTVLLTYSVIISFVASYMPPTSKHTSVLSVYNTIVLFVGSIAVLLTVYVLYCYHQSEDEEPPSGLQSFTHAVLEPLAKICSSKHRPRSAAANERDTTPEAFGKTKRNSDEHSGSDVQTITMGGKVKGSNNTVHPATQRSVKETENRKNSYHYGNMHDISSNGDISYSWQQISVILDSACARIFGIFVTLLTIICVLILIIGGYSQS